MTDFKAGEEKFNKTSLEHCVVPESKEEPKKNETVIKMWEPIWKNSQQPKVEQSEQQKNNNSAVL